MRGKRPSQTGFVSLIDVETLIAADHPIRAIKRMCDVVLTGMSGHFDEIYAADGAPSIPPETLLKGKVLQALYTVRSDRQLCARLQTDLMFRRFVDLPMDEAVFDASAYSKNQTRLLTHQVAELFFSEIVELARKHGWVSDDHFSVDGTLIEAWASMKSFRPKGDDQGPGSGNAWMDFKGEKRRNDTHASTTDSEAKLMRKGPGKEARLCFGAHAVMENRHGLCVLFDVKPAVGAPESSVAVAQARRTAPARLRPKNYRRRQGLPHEGVCEGAAGTGHRAASRPQGRAEDAARAADPGSCREPESPQAHRGDLWLDQNDRLLPQESLPWGRADARPRTVCGRHLESRADGKIVREPARNGAGMTPAGPAVCPHTA